MHGWILAGSHTGATVLGAFLYRIFGASTIAKLKADLAAAKADLAAARGNAASFIAGGTQAQKK